MLDPALICLRIMTVIIVHHPRKNLVIKFIIPFKNLYHLLKHIHLLNYISYITASFDEEIIKIERDKLELDRDYKIQKIEVLSR